MHLELFFLVLIFLGLSAVIYFLYLQQQGGSSSQDQAQMDMLLKMLHELRRDFTDNHGKGREELDRRLHQMTRLLQEQQMDTKQNLQEQFKQSAGIIQEVTRSLSKIQETNQKVVGFAEQMKSLENILKNPKQRGILGEYFLETLLSQVFSPQQYEMQYKMKNGEIVDAAIFYNELIIPIDAKFSLEKYNQIMEESDSDRRDALERDFKADIKRRIDETAKYIRPEEGTTQFAFMFIPAEGIYYNLLVYNVGTVNVNTEHLIEYAFRKHVILVSPTSFYAYLETVLHGMKAMKMESSIKEILGNVEKLSKHLGAYEEYLQKLGKSLGSTVNTYNLANREFKKIDKDVYKLSDGSLGGKMEVFQIEDKPFTED